MQRGRTVRNRRQYGGFASIGATGFEPATVRPPAECATRLRHAPRWVDLSLPRPAARVVVPVVRYVPCVSVSRCPTGRVFLALAVVLLSLAAGPAAADGAQARECGNYGYPDGHGGDRPIFTGEPIVGAGVYDIRTKVAVCRTARRMVRRFWNGRWGECGRAAGAAASGVETDGSATRPGSCAAPRRASGSSASSTAPETRRVDQLLVGEEPGLRRPPHRPRGSHRPVLSFRSAAPPRAWVATSLGGVGSPDTRVPRGRLRHSVHVRVTKISGGSGARVT